MCWALSLKKKIMCFINFSRSTKYEIVLIIASTSRNTFEPNGILGPKNLDNMDKRKKVTTNTQERNGGP